MAELHTVVQEGDAVLLKCDKVYKPAVVTKGGLVMCCALFGMHTVSFVDMSTLVSNECHSVI